MENEIIKMASFIKSSKNREKIVISLESKIKIPSEIAKDTELALNYTSMLLKELKDKEIIECLNEDSKRGRFYKLTKEGYNAVNFIK